MVLAISFLEAPLKFRAPGVTIPIGLGIGRMVFRALNLAEITLALVALAAIAAGASARRGDGSHRGRPRHPGRPTDRHPAATQPAIRPRARRSAPPRSTVHLYYVALEAAKVLTLTALGICLLTR